MAARLTQLLSLIITLESLIVMNVIRSLGIPTLTACLVALVLPVQSDAEPQGFYVTAYAQASRLSSTTFDEIGDANLGVGLTAEFDTGFGLGGDFGFLYGNGWAAELEWNWRRHELKSLEGAGSAAVSEGDFASNILFVNGLRRFDHTGGWVPYLGLGIGWVQEIDFDLNSTATERAWSKQGDLGVQLLGGAEIPLADKWRMTADLRLLRLGKQKLNAEEGVTGQLAKPEYDPVSVQIGLRRLF
jgi:opacity protein-like surface antigen